MDLKIKYPRTALSSINKEFEEFMKSQQDLIYDLLPIGTTNLNTNLKMSKSSF